MSDKIDKNEYDTCRECGQVEKCEDLDNGICEHCWRKLIQKNK